MNPCSIYIVNIRTFYMHIYRKKKKLLKSNMNYSSIFINYNNYILFCFYIYFYLKHY